MEKDELVREMLEIERANQATKGQPKLPLDPAKRPKRSELTPEDWAFLKRVAEIDRLS